MPSPAVPIIVVEGSNEAFRHALAELRAGGWDICERWHGPSGWSVRFFEPVR